jgi:hypothetical protein
MDIRRGKGFIPKAVRQQSVSSPTRSDSHVRGHLQLDAHIMFAKN